MTTAEQKALAMLILVIFFTGITAFIPWVGHLLSGVVQLMICIAVLVALVSIVGWAFVTVFA